jgi:hypothetical protein
MKNYSILDKDYKTDSYKIVFLPDLYGAMQGVFEHDFMYDYQKIDAEDHYQIKEVLDKYDISNF